ncbi:MAG: hypothetical protein STSR0008_13530 [Ignavibacterium sp.]
MFGKAAIYIVLGFSGLFLFITNNMFTYSNDALNNYTKYYDETISNNIAISAANIAANNIFRNSSWTSNINNVSFQNGKMTVVVNNLSFNRKEIVAISNYNSKKDTVKVMMQPSNFAKFAHFSVSENSIYYISGDTVWGPIHTQDKLYVDGSPVFWGKVTAKKGINKKDKWADPKFYGGYESGVSIPLPGDFTTVTSAAYSGGKVVTNKDVQLYFNGDGTVDYKEGSSSWQYDVPFDSLAPNGVFLVEKGNLYIKGTIKGQVTVAASQSTGESSHGKVYIIDDIVYKTDPTNPNCTDMLGIVATNDVVIKDVPETKNNNGIDIQASIFSLKGSFTAENYDYIHKVGSIRLYGGIIEKERGAVGTFDSNSGNLLHGYYKKYKYDERFMVSAPPAFPTTGSYEIISWLE